MVSFNVTKNHIKLLKNLYISWADFECGSPSVDPKRPFGNGDIYGDMARILGITLPNDEKEYEKVVKNLWKGYQGLQICLQILCRNLSIEEGTYICDDYKTNWRKENKQYEK